MVFNDVAYERGFPLLIGHRGGAIADHPENTISSFSSGVNSGAVVLETDVRMTRDGHVVTVHDPDLRRVAGDPRSISDTTFRELQNLNLVDGRGKSHDRVGIPRLDDVLSTFPDIPFNIDIKDEDPDLTDATIAVIRRLGAMDRVCLASFSPRTMRRVRGIAPEVVVSMHPGEIRRFLVSGYLVGGRALAIQLPRRHRGFEIVNTGLVRRAHRHSREVHVWTINDPAEARELAEMGVDGIITDDVAAMGDLPRKRLKRTDDELR